MIYGMSWIFGITGSLDFSVINKALSTPEHLPVLAVFIALVLILTGMGYKVSSVPFHMWAPDVYTGAPIPDHDLSRDRIEGRGIRAADALLLSRHFASGGRRQLDCAGGRRLAATAALRLRHHDDARQPRGAAAD